LLKVNDPDIGDAELHARIIARSKQLLQYEGLTHPDGTYEPGLDVARYVNAFPGTPGDYRAWIGGIRPTVDVIALLENLAYAYHRAKIVVLEEEMAKHGATVEQAAPKANGDARHDDPDRAYKVLIADLVGLRFGEDGEPDPSEVAAHIEACGGKFHRTDQSEAGALEPGTVHFFYQPHLSRAEEIIPVTEEGQYDALIAAATFMPAEARFAEGGVRIGAGTGNMACACWGGGDGAGGEAPLMNTPSFNSRATAHMTLKALLKVMPDLPVEELHARVIDGSFDTGKHLRDFPTEKLEGKKIAVIGFGNIGREVARLAKAFGMKVSVHARERHWDWIESEGFTYAESVQVAAAGADVISPHTGLGARNEAGAFANAGLIDDAVLGAMNHGAVVINYDRGEVIDAGALDRALESGQVRYAGIDADLFVDASDGGLSGPMVPYREIEARHRGKMELLPHAAADTEHVSRVEGAKQAVDQILGCIRHRRVVNLKGALPDGYSDGGAQTVNGVGRVTPQRLAGVAADAEAAKFLRALAEEMSAIWGALHATHDADRRAELLASYGADLVAASNRYTAMMDELGLQGPYAGN
ncbi:MAG: NAD(P)-dependent oxidoreductase, partial [Pseudomonadota bacterium]